ncbi:MAG: class I SAM-dependent methyltransferase [Chloroflexota bacterium]|nr:class I SAM-dependent methyltransferase [Chloroflexota bacterium]
MADIDAVGRVGAVPLAERLLVWSFRRFPPRSTIFVEAEGRPESEYEDEKRFGFHRYVGLGPELYANRDVLDLGCGFGGRTVRFAELGARSVTGVEISDAIVEEARAFAAERGAAVTFRVGSGEAIPLPDASVDLVLMNDVMEHVVTPAEVLAETARVLRPGGRLIVVFPPYYDLTGGSHLHGHSTRIPGLNLLFPSRVLRRAVRMHLTERGIPFDTFFRDLPTDKLFNLNGLTARGFRRLVSRSSFEAERLWYIGHRDRRLSDRPTPRWSLRSAAFAAFEIPAQLPVLQELCCARICVVLRAR